MWFKRRDLRCVMVGGSTLLSYGLANWVICILSGFLGVCGHPRGFIGLRNLTCGLKAICRIYESFLGVLFQGCHFRGVT